MSWYIIDIINFILIFLLMDFFNGINHNYLGKKLKSSIFAIALMCLADLVICVPVSFFFAAKIALLAIAILLIVAIIVVRCNIKSMMRYSDVETGKEELFGKQKVMILVPHEDDDINLAGGVIEEYRKHGSEVYVVFATNGDGDERFDMSQMGYIRMREAINALGVLGVAEKNIIFLGYGDGWDKNGPHIYNAPHDEVISSRAGRRETYGLDSHPAYHEGTSYTYHHYYNDIKQVILEHQPDTLFCIDYDTHNDHRALSMLFERVMGDILKTTDYRPVVYKGYGYRTAWNAPRDFYDSLNVLFTANHESDRDVVIYDWDKRVRFPVDSSSLSRNLMYCKDYKALSHYPSQKAVTMSESVINGDKVFWKRRTDSLLYNAEITVSSGDKDKLTDFMLLDCDDLLEHGDKPYDGVWRPDKDDNEKIIHIELNSIRYIDHLVLYDNPSPKDNILNAVIQFDDGTFIKTGKLQSNGAATMISVKKQVKSFSVRIVDYEGNGIGLTEIEAYSTEYGATPEFCKISDENGNFLYDCICPTNGEQRLTMYSSKNTDKPLNPLVFHSDNPKCKVLQNEKTAVIICPPGNNCRVSAVTEKNRILDSVIIRNPSPFHRKLLQYWRKELGRINQKHFYVLRLLFHHNR